MSETIKVHINADGVTAKEVNRFQKLRYKEYFSEMSPIIGKIAALEMYHRNNNNWQEAESKLRTFEIDAFCITVNKNTGAKYYRTVSMSGGWHKLDLNEIHSAEILDNDKLTIRIL